MTSRVVVAWDRFWFQPVESSTFALFRVAFGLLTLGYTLSLAPALFAFYSDDGILPAQPHYSGTLAWGLLGIFSSDAAVVLFYFLLLVGVLVVIHEFGHFLAAKLLDFKVLRFSIGFGRPLVVRRRGRDQTEWVLASIPLGGYVKMLDEREGEVAPGEAHRAFNRQGVWARIFIVLAGPVANFLLAVLVYWALFMTGLPGMKPVVADPARNTPAAAAGIAGGDTIRAVADEPVHTWSDVRWRLLGEAVKRGTTSIEYGLIALLVAFPQIALWLPETMP